MLHRAPTTPSSAAPRHALRGLVCLVLLGWMGKPASARVRSVLRSPPDDSSTPYLRVIGSAPLRFQPEPAPRELAAKTGAGSAPPFPTSSAATATPASPANDTATTSPASPPTADVSLVTPGTHPNATAPNASGPQPIIPDETRPRVQPEDFLPFFQFPASTGANGDVRVIAPINSAPNPPHHATPSTATYRQQ